MHGPGITLKREASLAIVVLDRPGRMNACNRQMFDQMAAIAQELETPPLPRAVIVTGAGPDAFCAGFDVNPDNPMVSDMAVALEQGKRQPIEKAIATIRTAVDRLVGLPIPVIAAINGKAYGGGAELAVRCDMRIMDPDAQICFSEVRLGLMPDWGGGATLAHLVGAATAADLILTGRRVAAGEALSLGLINRVSEPGKAVEAAIETAGQIMCNGPLAVQHALRVIRAGRDLSLHAALDFEQRTAVELIATGECLQGIGAFLNGQNPDFSDTPPD